MSKKISLMFALSCSVLPACVSPEESAELVDETATVREEPATLDDNGVTTRPTATTYVVRNEVDAALVTVVSPDANTRILLQIPDTRDAVTIDALVSHDGASLTSTSCLLSADDARMLKLEGCAGTKSAPVTFSVPRLDEVQEASRSHLLKIVAPEAADYSEIGIESVEGDECRAHCHYQWQLGILACFLVNPTPGCYDQVNLYGIACAAACPL